MLRLPRQGLALAITTVLVGGVHAGGRLLGFEAPPARRLDSQRTETCDPEEFRARGEPVGGARFHPDGDVPPFEGADEGEIAGAQALALLWFRHVVAADPNRASGTRELLLRRLLPEDPDSRLRNRLGRLTREPPAGLEDALPARVHQLARALGDGLEGGRRVRVRALARLLETRLEADDVAQVLLVPPDGEARALLVLRATEGLRGCGPAALEVLRLEVSRAPGAGGAGHLDLELDTGRLRASPRLARALDREDGDLPADWVLRPAAGRMRTAAPLLASWDPEIPADRVPAKAYRWGKVDGHRYVGLDGKHSFGRGTHMGTQVGPGGQLRLVPGARDGVWVSRPTRVPVRFDYVQVGVTGDPRGGRVRLMMRGFGPRMRQRTPWQPVRRESQVAMRMIAAFVQVAVMLISGGGSGPSPMVSGVNFSPGLLGMPGGGYQPVAFTPGGGGGAFRPPTYTPWGSNPGGYSPGSYPPGGGASIQPPSNLRIVRRSEWGARAPRGRLGRDSYRSITVHHTESPAAGYKGARSMRELQRFHQGTRGWSDIGYHYLIGPDGVIYEGRPAGTLGSHSPPNNGRLGLCLIGSFVSRDRPTPQALGSLQAMMSHYFRQGISPRQVFVHKQQRSTDCPGKLLAPLVPTVVARASSGSAGTRVAGLYP